MIQFQKSIELIQDELFKPQIGVFTLLDGIVTDNVGTQYIQLRFELLQNHQSGNRTSRVGVVQVPKASFDALNISYTGDIGNTDACKALLQSFNINDLSN